jgi:hypothetical protein
MRRLALLLLTLAASLCALPASAQAACNTVINCPAPDVQAGSGSFEARYVARSAGGTWIATNEAPLVPAYVYRLVHPCVWDDAENGGCRASDFFSCPSSTPDRVLEDLVLLQRPVVMPGPTTDDGTAFNPDTPVGTPVGQWGRIDRSCVDITALNPPPSPAEIFRYFQTLPLPQLPTRQQPPGNGLVGLPVIFFTDGPTTQTHTLDIRGFTVDITATAFTWHTGDGTDLTTTTPGAPPPGPPPSPSTTASPSPSPAAPPPTAHPSPSTSSRPDPSSPTPTTDRRRHR